MEIVEDLNDYVDPQAELVLPAGGGLLTAGSYVLHYTWKVDIPGPAVDIRGYNEMYGPIVLIGDEVLITLPRVRAVSAHRSAGGLVRCRVEPGRRE